MFERFCFSEPGCGVIKISENAILPFKKIFIFAYCFQEIRVLVYSCYSHQITVFTYPFLHVWNILIKESNNECRCKFISLVTDNVVGDTAAVVHCLRLRSTVERDPWVVWLIVYVILFLSNHLIENVLKWSFHSRRNRADVVSRVPPCVLCKTIHCCSIETTTISHFAGLGNEVRGADSPFGLLLTDVRWCRPWVSEDIYILIWIFFDEFGEATIWVNTTSCHLCWLESVIRSTLLDKKLNLPMGTRVLHGFLQRCHFGWHECLSRNASCWFAHIVFNK